MCVGDYRLGRLIRVRALSFIDPQPPLAVLPYNKDRVGVSFAMIEAITDAVIAIRADGATRPIIYFQPDTSFWHFTLKDHGDLPMQEWRIGANPNSNTLYVFEYILPERVLEDEIARYASPYKVS